MPAHMLSKSGGPCWNRQLGYHQPKPLPSHIMRILLQPAPKAPAKSEKENGGQ